MNPISAIRAFSPLDTTPLAGLGSMGSMGSAGAGGITSAQFEKLASAIDVGAAGAVGKAQGGGFSDVLGEMVRDVQGRQTAASSAMNGVLTGEGVPLHEAVLASEEASISFQLLVEIRNKLLESYQELMRMQV